MGGRKTSGKKVRAKPRVHKDLEGLEVSVDAFGEIKSNTDIDKIKEFLDKNVDDKKLLEREEKINKSKKKSTKG